MKKLILLIAISLFCFKISYSQPGTLDASFGNNGIVRTDFGTSTNIYIVDHSQVLIAADGTLYIIFSTNEATLITRLLSNGTVDASYGNNGYSQPTYVYNGKGALQPDGKIVMTGNHGNDFDLARYNTDGTLDTAFSANAKKTTGLGFSAGVVAIQSDGKIVVSTYTNINGEPHGSTLVRYNTDGTIDTTFSKDGKQSTVFNYITSMAIQRDDKIIVLANSPGDIGLARYYTDGTLDTTFSKDGKQPTDFGSSVAIQSDGKIVVADYTSSGNGYVFALARYNTNGTLDKTFSEDGKLTTDFGSSLNFAYSIALQGDGKIVVAGFSEYDFALARYNSNGTFDSTFSQDGKQTTDFNSSYDIAYSAAIQSDGKIVVAGRSENDFAVARYNTNGTLDKTFSEDGKFTDYLHEGSTNYTSTVLQSDGKIVVAGNTNTGNGNGQDFALARYNTDGTLDTTFSKDGKQTTDFDQRWNNASSIALQADGRIVVGGDTYDAGSQLNYFNLARYKTDGSLDSTFSEDGKQTGDFSYFSESGGAVSTQIGIQRDGKIVVEGYTDVLSGRGFALARYNTNGTLDTTFSGNGIQITDLGSDAVANSLAIQSDGKLVVVGFIGGGNGADFVLARYNTDGTLDKTFSDDGKQTTDFGLTDEANSIAIQNDGRIVVAGFTSGYGSSAFALARYNADGTLDKTFSEDGKLTTDFGPAYDNAYSVALQSDGKIVVAGVVNQSLNNSESVLVRYNSNGSLDSSFGEDGIQVTDAIKGSDGILDMVISNNKLYAVGSGKNPGIIGVVARHLLDDNSNTPPTVSLTTPTNNTTRLAPAAHIKLSATASDKDGSISKVEFYNGTHLLQTEYEAPYGFVWRNVPLGNYTLTAKAYDNSGLVTTSDAVHISVVPNKPPTVSIIKPKNNQPFAAPGYIHFEADAKDVDGRITRVEFYNGSTLLRTEYEYPYTYVLKNLPVGTYTITAVATDNWGAHTTSAPVTFRVIPRNTTIVSNRPSSVNNKTGISDAVSVRLAPNPANSMVNIYTTGLQQNKPATISVISASGVVMKTMHSNSSAKTIQLDVSSFVSGVYTIQLISGDKVIYKQFVKL